MHPGAVVARHQPPESLALPTPIGFVGELEGELTVDLGDKVKVRSQLPSCNPYPAAPGFLNQP